jgi:enolase
MLSIRAIHALEILDSRGNPTLSASVELSDGTRATAHVPSGASTGRHEAVELRDGDPGRYGGKGVRKAVANVELEIAAVLAGMSAEDQGAIDRRMIELDGTPGKSRLGANAILGVSCAVARAVAVARKLPLWQSLAGGQTPALPVPMINIISGGLHAGQRIEVQDFLVIPRGFDTLAQSLERVVALHKLTGELLRNKGYTLTGVADEGGWGPALERNEIALEVLTEAIAWLGLKEKIAIAVDVAASHFYRDGLYHLQSENRSLQREEMIDLLAGWVRRYPVTSIEDGLDEDDWQGWSALTARLSAQVQLVGDDLFTTNPSRLRRGIESGAANAVLVKMNQIGTLTETFEVVRLAREAGYRAVISARSGETEDSFLADLAVASGAGQIKIGSITRSERLAKYNRLLEIEAREKP